MNNKRGITLISLVVTIIVLLILAGVTLYQITSNNGVLEKATTAKETMDETKYEELIRLGINEQNIIDSTNKNKSLFDVLNNISGLEEVIESEDEGIVYVKYKNNVWTVYSNGYIIKEKIDVWDGTVDETGFLGAGTKADPYQINTAEQLAYLAKQVNNGNKYENSYFSLNVSVDLNSIPWFVIGGKIENSTSTDDIVNGNLFNGIFEGNNSSVYNLVAQYELSEGIGLFGTLGSDGKISNITIKSGDIMGRLLVGGVVGVNYGTIENCHNFAKVTAKSYNEEPENGNYAGGITGYNYLTIRKCSNSGNIIATNGNNYWNGGWAAGIAGYSVGDIEDCQNSGDIYAKHYRAGGIVGTFQVGIIRNCSNTGKIYSGWRGAGGIVGLCAGGAQIYDCINEGEVSVVTDESGGIAGYLSGNINENNTYSIIQNCINNGTIRSGSDEAGGIIGGIESTGDIIIGCVNNGTICGLDEGEKFRRDFGGIVGCGVRKYH